MNLQQIIERSHLIREKYHQLERINHQKEWSVIEDALAFLTDAGLVGRLTMSQQERWVMSKDTMPELEHKLAECVWWLAVLSKRMDIDLEKAMETFLSGMEQRFLR
ncbi:hypothetical protein [Pelistega ratti]|uniref:hypothetical protein n=1 Tax=Pelistega ratti TaxID=2652177 RepID=UPI0019156DBE|nr:hypothetical protein [Pelistega ratti]